MGRNVKEVSVPVNGATWRNGPQLGPFVDSDGAVYIPSTVTYTVAASDYPKFVSLNSGTTIGLASSPVNPSAIKSGGIVDYKATRSFGLDSSSPYIQSPSYHPVFNGKYMKDKFLGSRAENGNYVVLTQKELGYRASSGGCPALIFNTSTKAYIDKVCNYAYIAWYDSVTSTYRVIGTNNASSETAQIFTSSNGVDWSSTTCTVAGDNVLQTDYIGSGSYNYTTSMVSGQNVVLITRANTQSAQYAIFCSGSNGSAFVDRTTALNGSAQTYFYPSNSGGGGAVCYNYDGTTLFVGNSTTSSGRYSTNLGANWSNATVSGYTSSWDNNHWFVIKGASKSQFMLLYNSTNTSNKIFYTANGGQSFTSVQWTPSVSLDPNYSYMSGDYDTATNTWCFVYQTTSGAYAARSTNNGTTWTHSRIDTKGTNSIPLLVWLDDAFYYHDGSSTLYRSTTGATWTAINALVTSPNGWAYGTPWYTLTDYVVFTNTVIKKSDQSVALLWSNQLLGIGQRTFNGYITSDYFISFTAANPAYSHALSSATASSYTFFTNTTISGQQTYSGTHPINIEYWRIK